MSADRLPPASQEAERSVLGSILLDAERVIDLCDKYKVKPEAFHIPAIRLVYEQARALASKGAIVDVMSVTEGMASAGTLEQAGGATGLHRLIDDTPTAAHAEYYIDILCRKWTLRRIIDAARETEQAVYDAGADDVEPEEIRSRAEFKFASISNPVLTERSNRELYLAQRGRWEKSAETGCAGLPTGLHFWDKYFGGCMTGGVYFLSGEAKAGKTSVAKQIAKNCVRRGDPVGFFTHEMSAEFMMGSTVASVAGQNVFYLNTGNVRRIDWGKLEEAADIACNWPLHLDETIHTPGSLWSAARRMITKRGVKLFVLDSIQLMGDDPGPKTLEEKLSARSAAVRQMAKVLGVPWIVISGLARVGSSGHGGGLRGSGMMDYDCAGHIQMIKPDDDDTLRIARFKANRYGPGCSDVTLKLDPDTMDLEEVGKPEQQPPPAQDTPDWFREGPG